MPLDPLRVSSYCAYLGSWLVLAVAAMAGAVPKLRSRLAADASIDPMVILGTLLQVVSPLPITRFLPPGPLNPSRLEMAGALLLAPFAAAMFVWAVRSGPRESGPDTLVTTGAYAWLRHPIYLALLAMLLATGLLASGRLPLLIALFCYLAGTELRIAVEERGLALKFNGDFAQYRQATPWRYLPGFR